MKYYDTDDAVSLIRKNTGLKTSVIARVLMENDRYLTKIGVYDITDQELVDVYIRYMGIITRLKYALKKRKKR